MTPGPSEAPRAGGRPQKRAAGGVVATWIRLVVATLVGILQAPILFGSLPPDELGTWYLFFAVATLVGLSDVGLPATFGRAVSRLWGRESSAGQPSGPELPPHYHGITVPELYASAFVATALLSLAFAAVALPPALVYFDRVLPTGAGGALVPLLTFFAGVVLNLMAAIPGACLAGSGDVALDGGVRTVAVVVGFGLVLALVPAHPTLETLCLIYVAQGAFALVAGHVVLRARSGIGKLREMRLDFRLMRGMYAESASVFVSRVGQWLTFESTLLIAGSFLGSSGIADFGILRQLAAIGASVTSAIPAAISPHVTAAHAVGDEGKVRSLYAAALRYTLVVNLLWTIGFLLWAPTAIGLLVGREHFLGYGVLVPIALGTFLELHGATHGYFMWSVGKWPFAPVVLAGGVLNLLLASVGCAFFSFPGLAWGSMAAQTLTMYWAQPWLTLRQLGVALRAYVQDTIRPALRYGAALALSASALRWGFDALLDWRAGAGGGDRMERVLLAFAAVAITALLAAVLAWVFTLTAADRDYFFRLARLKR